MASDCIFCKIVAGEIPCYRVYEDDRVLAFLDVGPLSHGHVLVIPKTHAVRLNELADEDAAAIGVVLPRLGRAVSAATGTRDYNILQNNGEPAGQLVMHVHFHLIPKPTPGSDSPVGSSPSGSGLGLHWPGGTLDPEAAKTLTDKITFALG